LFVTSRKSPCGGGGALAALSLLAVVLFLAGCPQTTDDPTYTVWTDSVSYAEFSSQVGTLNDGYYVRAEMTNAQFSQMASSLTDEYRHDWTESQIYDWFIGRGFGSAEANQEKSWLVTINHGFIASRTGSVVYLLVK
jgi:hypothetical protein